MKRRTFTAACLGLSSATGETTVDEFYKRLTAFDKLYQTFVNTLCNWPAAGEKCDPNLGHIDYGAFRKAGEAARRLWPAEDK